MQPNVIFHLDLARTEVGRISLAAAATVAGFGRPVDLFHAGPGKPALRAGRLPGRLRPPAELAGALHSARLAVFCQPVAFFRLAAASALPPALSYVLLGVDGWSAGPGWSMAVAAARAVLCPDRRAAALLPSRGTAVCGYDPAWPEMRSAGPRQGVLVLAPYGGWVPDAEDLAGFDAVADEHRLTLVLHRPSLPPSIFAQLRRRARAGRLELLFSSRVPAEEAARRAASSLLVCCPAPERYLISAHEALFVGTPVLARSGLTYAQLTGPDREKPPSGLGWGNVPASYYWQTALGLADDDHPTVRHSHVRECVREDYLARRQVWRQAWQRVCF